MMRILFVLIAAAVITFGAIFTGNYLLRKVADAEMMIESGETDEGSDDEYTPSAPSGKNYDSPDVFGASLILADCKSEDEAVLAVNTLAQSYDTILLHINDSEGMLTYTSPALCQLNRMPSPEENPQFRLFASAAAAVKAQNKRLCVLLTPNFTSSDLESAALSDGTLISELALYGVDEVLVDFPENLTLSNKVAESLYDYIVSARRITKNVCPIGVLLSYEHYLDNHEIMEMETIADAASFLAIRFSADEGTPMGSFYRKVSSTLTTLLGSFNVYNMRILLDGSNKLLAAAYEACNDAGMGNICFMSGIIPGDLEHFDQSEDSTDTEISEKPQTIDPSDNTNPYSFVPETEAETEVPYVPQQPEEQPSGETPWY